MTEDRPVVDIFLAETSQRQFIDLAPEGRTTQVRLRGARPVRVFELEAAHGFVKGGGRLLVPDVGGARSGLAPLAAALEHLARRPGDVLLVAGHGAAAAERAAVVQALLAGDADAFVAAAAGAGVGDWQALLGWAARARGIACDPGAADGVVGKKTRAGLAGLRAALGLVGGDADAPGPDDWRALFAQLGAALAELLGLSREALDERRGALSFVQAGAVGCASHWPTRSVAILDHSVMADERVDVLCFAPEDAPRLRCHAEGGACDPKACDVYRKGKYRCEHCHPREPQPGFTCLEVEGPHFDFDRSLVRPDGLPALARIKAAFDEDPRREGMVYGHTDTVGSEEYNKLLSERRARAVLAVLTHDVDAWQDLWQEEGWGDDVAHALARAVSDEAKQASSPRAGLQAFQRARGLDASGRVDAATRAGLIQAYFESALPEPVPAERFRALGGARYAGCSELNPVGDGTDERSRRVVVMVYDPAAAPGDLPCTVGDLGPCQASCRPAPPSSGPPGETATFRCAVYRRLAALCACKQQPGPVPPPTTLQILAFTGAGPDQRPASELTIEPHERVQLAWKVTGATKVVLSSVVEGRGTTVWNEDAGLEGEKGAYPPPRGETFVLEASAGAEKVEARVVVTVLAPERPVIKSFSGAVDPEVGPEMSFSWSIAGPFGRVQLLPYGRDVTADTDPAGVGSCEEPPVGGPRVEEYELQVFDQAGELADSRSFERRTAEPQPVPEPPGPDDPLPPPRPTPTTRIVQFAAYDALGSDHTLRTAIDKLPPEHPVTVVAQVEGPYERIHMAPYPGLLTNGPGVGWQRTFNLDPHDPKQAPGPGDRYTLTVDRSDTRHLTVRRMGKANEYVFVVPWKIPIFKHAEFWYFELSLSCVVGIKGKASAPDTESDLSIKTKISNKPQISAEVATELKLEGNAPDWVVDKVQKIEATRGATLDGEGIEVSLALEVVFKPIQFSWAPWPITPKGELEFVGIKVAVGEDGNWELKAPGTITFKPSVEHAIGKVLQKHKPTWLLDWDLSDVKLFGGFELEAEPDWLKIAMYVIGAEALFVGGLIIVAVGTLVATVWEGVKLGRHIVASNLGSQWREDIEHTLAGLPAGLRDDSVDTLAEAPQLPADSGGALSDPMTRHVSLRFYGEATGRRHRWEMQRFYRDQYDIRKTIAARRAEGIPQAAIDQQILAQFRGQWKEHYAKLEQQAREAVSAVIRRKYYYDFITSGAGVHERDIVFRWLYLTEDRLGGVDYDYPDVWDDVFVLAMRDLWDGAQPALDRKYLTEQWKRAGYTKFPPDAEDREAKRMAGGPVVYDINTGKRKRWSELGPREATFDDLRRRGFMPRLDFIAPRETDLGVRLSWPNNPVFCLADLPGCPRMMECYAASTAALTPIIMRVASSDYGSEAVVVDVMEPKRVKPTGSGPTPTKL